MWNVALEKRKIVSVFKQENLNKTGVKRKCMDSSTRECQKNLIRIKLGNGYPKMI